LREKEGGVAVFRGGRLILKGVGQDLNNKVWGGGCRFPKNNFLYRRGAAEPLFKKKGRAAVLKRKKRENSS